MGAIFDGKKGKRMDDAPTEGSNPRSPSKSTSEARWVRNHVARRARRDATMSGTRPSLSTWLERALEWPLEAPVYSTTC
jgi:hypothetical protein